MHNVSYVTEWDPILEAEVAVSAECECGWEAVPTPQDPQGVTRQGELHAMSFEAAEVVPWTPEDNE